MNLSKKKFNKCFHFFIILHALMFFTSCKSDVKIVVQKDSISIKYSTKLGEALFDTVYAFVGEDEEGQIFDTEQFKTVFMESGLKNVLVKSEEIDQISIQAVTDKGNADFISQSSILERSDDGKSVEIIFSKERMLEMYEKMPVMMRSYIDLFMAPVFTEETMTDAEYLELVASVYGQVLADEIADSMVNFEVKNSDGKSKDFSLRLLDLININEGFKLKI